MPHPSQPRLTLPGIIAAAKPLLILAGPVIVAQFAQTANGFVDTLMAGRAGAADLAAVALGTSIWLPLYLLIVGIMTASSSIVSHLFGAGATERIGAATHQALWCSLPLGLISFFLLQNASPVLAMMHVEAHLIPLTQDYLDGIAWGFPAICAFLALRFHADGMGFTRPVMIVSLIGLGANIPANYILIFGKFGFPALGGPGCGWATAFVMWLMLGLMWLSCRQLDRNVNTGIGQHLQGPDWRSIRHLLGLGLPIGMSIFFEVSVFCVIALMLGSLGTTVIAGHQVALNVSSLAFMLPLSLSLALGVRLGHAAGARDVHSLRHTAAAGMLLVLVAAVCNASIMALARDDIAGLYTTDPAIIALATELLLFAALFQLSDGLQVGAAGALRGLKDTRIPMLITLFSYWVIALAVGYALGFGAAGLPALGAHGFWIGLLAGLTTAAILLNMRLNRQMKQHVDFLSR